MTIETLSSRPKIVSPSPAAAPGRLWEINTLGLRFHPFTKAQLLDEIFRPRLPGETTIVSAANLHGLYINCRNAEFDQLQQDPRTIVIVDGMPVVWLLRLLGCDVRRDHRTTWVDWFEDMLSRAAREGRSVFILGHTPEMLELGLAKARAKWPALRIEGAHGFFSIEPNSPDAPAAIARVNAYAPDIVIVGMGMPRQEIFTIRFGSGFKAPVIGLGGAAFAYFAGFEPTPPRWMGRWGIEWLYRLIRSPRRLMFRYIIEPLFLAFYLGRRLLRGR
jgi:N-acetylglucosaminyldiphosphoundecaprenol N-acetyl-beta-D-mannosaminyltransferase